MIRKWLDKFRRGWEAVRDFLDEKAFASVHAAPLSRLQKFAHFWLVVAKNFWRTRCPVHASALAYTSLLALIPTLFVVISVSSGILRQQGDKPIRDFIDSLLVTMTPPSSGTNNLAGANTTSASITNESTTAGSVTNFSAETNNLSNSTIKVGSDSKPSSNREEVVEGIDRFITNIKGARLGVTGAVLLVWLAIAMLSSIEGTFNDIWGVRRGRSWPVRIEKYGAVLFLGPLLLGLALGLTNGPHLQTTREWLQSMPVFRHVLFQIVPAIAFCLAFTIFYLLIPNTKVHWDAALVGGFVGGILWQLNNYVSVLYVSRWITNSRIYGSLAVIPVFMVGLYFSWLILLFGAQVAYAYQNRAAYLQEKQAENINQRGREFIALRLMEYIGQRFQRGQPPVCVGEIAEDLSVPARLVHRILQTLLAARLVVEVVGEDPAFAPARPLESITCHDILLALRAGQGQELATRDEPARVEVFGEFTRIMEAEKNAASAVTILAMVTRTKQLAADNGPPVNELTERKTNRTN